ncbi:3-keto-5-aminohexanoate cleavage protein [Lentzea sp. HUAS12]|uniref:3-keto-5-aminohexanoate cleavage protein n=1 Tax=Lentzea sp. HUAS12 TaxID=2951806 RepID=UPI0020A0783E|nr:3-keto-5-aminohexanoate cleavage protein [Lentzea sp. HUAS12]USX53580.1 3-keto-5-aminohexanoate cleavage protein [Lentzea sp. HUAS12]
MLQVCLNGALPRSASDHLPFTPAELAEAARAAVEAGAQDVHIHPKDSQDQDTLSPEHVGAAVEAVRAAVPGVPVGVTTGDWIDPSPHRRAELIRSWTVLPDHASVNWHEDGAEIVAEALLDKGVGIEAGLFSGTEGAKRFLDWPHAHLVTRVLAEITDEDPATASAAVETALEELAGFDRPVLLHGEGGAAWEVLRIALARGLDTRIGLEDTLVLPGGEPATGNFELVRAAFAYRLP